MVDRTFTGLNTEQLNAIMQMPSVRAAIAAKAERALPRTKAIALSAGAAAFAEALEIQTGTRPGRDAKRGLRRSYARIAAKVTPEIRKRDKAAKLTRRQILRRGSLNA